MQGMTFDPKELVNEIGRFTLDSPENRFPGTDIPIWDAPLAGFSRGDDALYPFLKEHIGAFHWSPAEVYGQEYPDDPARGDDLSIVSYILPQSGPAKEEQRRESLYPGKYWAMSRTTGEDFNRLLMAHIVEYLQTKGVRAAAASLSQHFAMFRQDRHQYASNWSERYVAYISGLGTFGLSDGLITAKGKAMRCGSAVFKAAAEPTERPYGRHDEYCAFDRGCRACIARCPAGAITGSGHDKLRCRQYQIEHALPHSRDAYRIESHACGLCQCGVPCESGIPQWP